jgi:hypothetical protein
MSDELMRLIIVFFGLFLVLLTCAIAHAATMKNIGQFGSDDARKHDTAARSLANLYIAVAGVLVIALAAVTDLSSDSIAVMFVAVLGSLGVKIFDDLKSKAKTKLHDQSQANGPK